MPQNQRILNMTKQKTSKFGQWLGKMLYALIVSYHHEDYVSEKDGKVEFTPTDIWHKNALNKIR